MNHARLQVLREYAQFHVQCGLVQSIGQSQGGVIFYLGGVRQS